VVTERRFKITQTSGRGYARQVFDYVVISLADGYIVRPGDDYSS
jgi:hypothetical protein